MNNTYQMNGYFDSNNRIYEGYFTEYQKKVSRLEKAVEMFLYWIYMAVRALTSARAKSMYFLLGFIGNLVGVIAVIGGMEAGRISLFGGVCLGILFCAVEYLIIFRRQSA